MPAFPGAARKAQTVVLQPVSQVLRRLVPAAALPLALIGTLALGAVATAQTPQDIPQQPPAPIVRPRPRPQTTAPPETSPSAAPITPRPPRPAPPATTASQPVPPKLSAVLNRTYIVLDPAHGGPDSGSRIGDNLLEKDIDLAFAFRLRALLAARGFTVVLTRDSDAALTQSNPSSPNSPAIPLTLDLRAGIANHVRPAACLLLHATGRGTGVHLYTSELDPAPDEAALLPWLTAQAAWIPASQQLSFALAAALGRSHIPLVTSSASVRPVDSLTCPAAVLELAPETSDPRSLADAGYQERVATAVAGALIFWQSRIEPPPKPLNLTAPTHHHATPPTTSNPTLTTEH